MKLILLCAAYILIPVGTKIWMERVLKSYKEQDALVSYRPYVWIVGVITTVFFVALGCWSAMAEEPALWATIGFFAFSLLGVCLIVAYIRCRIGYNPTSFTVVGFWGKARTFSYKDITAMYTQPTGTVLYCGEQRVWVEDIASGSREFLSMVNARYKAYHGGLSIPKAALKKDLFNGHIRNPWEFVICYVLLFVLSIAMIVMLVVLTQRTYDETNTTQKQCSFTSCRMINEELVFTSAEGDVYKMEFAPDQPMMSKLSALCDEKTVLTVYARESTSEDEKPYYGIEQIETAESIVFSFEQSREIYWQQNGRWIALFVGGIIALLWLYIGLSVWVGRNVSKVPRPIVKLFFKEQYVVDYE